MQDSTRTAWQKSSYSPNGNNCVELAVTTSGRIHLRESDDPDTVLTATPSRLQALLALVRTHRPVA